MSSDLAEYRANYAAALLSSTAYGAYIIIASLSVYLLVKHGQNYRCRRITLGYTAFMSILTTVWFMSGSRTSAFQFVDAAFVDTPEDIGCSVAFVLTKVTAMLQILASDGALLYRTSLIWCGDKRIMVPLLLIYLTTMGFGILSELFCVDIALWNASMTMHAITFVTTVILNILMTLAIAVRIWRVRRDCPAAASGVESRMMGILAVLAESAALYAVVGIVLVPSFLNGATATAEFSTLLQSLAFLSPAVIVLRVAMGVSFDNDVATLRRETIFGAPPDSESMQPRLAAGEKADPQEQLRSFDM